MSELQTIYIVGKKRRAAEYAKYISAKKLRRELYGCLEESQQQARHTRMMEARWAAGRIARRKTDDSLVAPVYVAYIPKSVAQKKKLLFRDVIISEIDPLVRIKKKGYYPTSYSKFFQPSYSEDTLGRKNMIPKIKQLFSNYASIWQRIIKFHWNRHHADLARTIVKDIPDDQSEALRYLLSQRQQLMDTYKGLNEDGSFMRRIGFSIAQLKSSIESNKARDNFEKDSLANAATANAP